MKLWLILLMLSPVYIVAMILAIMPKRHSKQRVIGNVNGHGSMGAAPQFEKEETIIKNSKGLEKLEDVSKYFNIDVTETDTHFLVGVKCRSNGEDMLISMGLCEFPGYIDWWYGMEVSSEDHKYALKKDTYVKAKPDEEDPDTDEVRTWIEMFIFEHKYAFRHS